LKKEKHFFKVILDLDQRVQFILCIDCRSEVFTIYALERYAVINKISPGLKLKYKQHEMVPLDYHGEKEGSMLELIDSISTSFQHLDDAHLFLTDNLSYALSEVYDDWIASDVTLPC